MPDGPLQKTSLQLGAHGTVFHILGQESWDIRALFVLCDGQAFLVVNCTYECL